MPMSRPHMPTPDGPWADLHAVPAGGLLSVDVPAVLGFPHASVTPFGRSEAPVAAENTAVAGSAQPLARRKPGLADLRVFTTARPTAGRHRPTPSSLRLAPGAGGRRRHCTEPSDVSPHVMEAPAGGCRRLADHPMESRVW